MPGVLDGVRVLDFGRYIAGPYCATLLGYLGAEVIRVEKLDGGEDRYVYPLYWKEDGSEGDGSIFMQVGVNTKSMTLNPAKPTGNATRKLPPTERKALEILDARDTMTKAEIRKQYKSLVKDLHPDMNGGDRSDEDRLQEVVWAWDQIKDSRYFRD